MFRLCARLEPLTAHLRRFQPPEVASVTSAVHLGFLIAAIILLAWPDIGFAMGFLKGFEVLGALAASGVMPVDPRFDPGVCKKLLFDGAEAKTRELLQRLRVQEHSSEIEKECKKDFDDGKGSRLFTFDEIVSMFGSDGWRAIPRFVLEQMIDKFRCIDDGLKGEQNEQSSSPETLVLPASTFPGQASALITECADQNGIDLVGEKVVIEAGKDDWPAAFRHMPTDPKEQPLYIVAFKAANGSLMFQVMWGALMGLLGVVVVFSRHPVLHVAMCRRWLGLVTDMYFDDQCVVD